MKKIRTTIVLPEEDVKLIKMLAASNGLTMSEVVQRRIHQTDLQTGKAGRKKVGGWRALAGSLNLGGKEPPTREQLYDDYFREKNSR
jgi:hypothetical protein